MESPDRKASRCWLGWTLSVAVGMQLWLLPACDKTDAPAPDEAENPVPSAPQAVAGGRAANERRTTPAVARAASDEIEQKSLRIAEDVLGRPRDEIDRSAPLVGTKNKADALDVTQLVLELSDAFKVEIKDSDLGPDGPATKGLTLDGLIAIVRTKLKKPGP